MKLEQVIEIVQPLSEFPDGNACIELLCQLQSLLYGVQSGVVHFVVAIIRSATKSRMYTVFKKKGKQKRAKQCKK